MLKEKYPDVEEFEACKINNIYSFCVDDLIISCYDWQELKSNEN